MTCASVNDTSKLRSPLILHTDRYYYYYNSGLQQQYVIYSQASITGEATVFLDPNTLSADGTVALSGLEFSEDGKYVCYNLSKGGSDWSEIKVRRPVSAC